MSQETIVRSRPLYWILPVYAFTAYWVFGLAIDGYNNGKFAVFFIGIAMVCIQVWAVVFSATSRCRALVKDDAVQFEWRSFGRKLSWSGGKTDILRLVHQKRDLGESEAEVIVLDVRNIGATLMTGWRLADAKVLGDTVGLPVEEAAAGTSLGEMRWNDLRKKLSQTNGG